MQSKYYQHHISNYHSIRQATIVTHVCSTFSYNYVGLSFWVAQTANQQQLKFSIIYTTKPPCNLYTTHKINYKQASLSFNLHYFVLICCIWRETSFPSFALISLLRLQVHSPTTSCLSCCNTGYHTY